ncbi:sugar transferase [Flaviflexus huanghaiensis]|uniref:sugar transferase n=1 Tax=Flaviflexus huanghaiensis TaxID=1111473 RepID=UPI001889AE40|nr:sugar transferase [Flaviflexus huanghaiensis]
MSSIRKVTDQTEPKTQIYRDHGKRLFDVLGALAGIVILAPVFAGVALTIRVSMGSPVLFRQVRPGQNERLFTLLKFRTMVEGTGPDRDRVTVLGKFLRSSSLDELPQLLNILKGEMSFIGPRPLTVKYLDFYSEVERQRHQVRPGITGLAQISGRNALQWEDRFGLDIAYVEGLSVRMDVAILLRTIRKVASRNGVTIREEGTVQDFDVHRSLDTKEKGSLE